MTSQEHDGLSTYLQVDCLSKNLFMRKICWGWKQRNTTQDPRYWPFARGTHLPRVNSAHKSVSDTKTPSYNVIVYHRWLDRTYKRELTEAAGLYILDTLNCSDKYAITPYEPNGTFHAVIFAFNFQSFELSVYTDRPDITPCFEYTLLIWLPLVTMLVMLPLSLLYYKGVPPSKIKAITCLFTTKQVNKISYSDGTYSDRIMAKKIR